MGLSPFPLITGRTRPNTCYVLSIASRAASSLATAAPLAAPTMDGETPEVTLETSMGGITFEVHTPPILLFPVFLLLLLLLLPILLAS